MRWLWRLLTFWRRPPRVEYMSERWRLDHLYTSGKERRS